MQEIYFLLGDSPRTIKRFTNIYRILRTHTKFKQQDDATGDYFSAMVLLAVIVGQPEMAESFCVEVRMVDAKLSMVEFLSSFIKGDNRYVFRKLMNELSGNTILSPYSKLSVERFLRNMGLIKRFSFRHLSVE